jgi:hypothetical protein
VEYAYDGIGRSTTETWYDDDGDTVADRTVGFTYDSSVAAVHLRRQRAYAESNAENYRLGVARIAAEQGEGLVPQGRPTSEKRPVSLLRHV